MYYVLSILTVKHRLEPGVCCCLSRILFSLFTKPNLLSHYFILRENRTVHHVYERTRSIRYQKGKLNVIKRQKNIIFRSVGFAD